MRGVLAAIGPLGSTLAAVALLASPASAGFSNTEAFKFIEFNWTSSDMDGFWHYGPQITTDNTVGWDNHYSEGFTKNNDGKTLPLPTTNITQPNYVYGRGTSSHTTTLGGATINAGFLGTAIYMLGEADPNLLVTITVDGNDQPGKPANGYLASATGLTFGYHNVTLKVNGNGQHANADTASWMSGLTYTFRGAIITTGMYTSKKAVSFANVAPRTENCLTGDLGSQASAVQNNFFNVEENNGFWSKVVHLGKGVDTPDDDVEAGTLSGFGLAGIKANNEIRADMPSKILNYTASATMTFQVPPGTGLMTVNGSTHNDISVGHLTINPAPPLGPDTFVMNATQVYADLATLALVVLDPNEQYTASIAVDDDAYKFALTNVTFWGTDIIATPKNHKLNVGAIAGGVVGGVVGLALIIGALFFFFRWRRNRHRIQSPDDHQWEIDEVEVHQPPAPGARQMSTVEPFYGGKSVFHEHDPAYAAGAGYPTPLSWGSPSDGGSSQYGGVSAYGSSQGRRPTKSSYAPPMMEPQIHQELDAGAAPPVITIPPGYDPSWAAPSEAPTSPTTAPSHHAPSHHQ